MDKVVGAFGWVELEYLELDKLHGDSKFRFVESFKWLRNSEVLE